MKNEKFKMKNLGIIILITILLGISPAFAADMADPMRIGVGARSMGMGKAYVGLAEDGDALFLNPAGIARNPNIKISSMYSNLLNDVSYTVLGGVYPRTDKSAWGVGYVGSRTGDIILRSATGTQEGTANWGNNVLFVSYGTYISEILPALTWGRDLLLGGSLKYYSAGASGDFTSSDSGIDMDLSMLVPRSYYANLGVNAQNLLSTTMSESGDEIPSCIKVGTKVALIGNKDTALMPHRNRSLNLVLDANLENNRTTGNAGLELWPTRNFALRMGSDGGEMTAGMGIRFFGIEFDYAYHPYSGVPENATHYFSLCYLGEVIPRMLRVKLESPADKAVIYEDFVRVSGVVEVEGGEEGEEEIPVVLKVNDVSVPLGTDLSFNVDIPIDQYGKTLLSLQAEAGLAREAKQVRLVRLTSFADVPEGYWAKNPIENTSTVGLIKGYPDGSFRPDGELSRAELATLMVRAKGIEVKGIAKKVFKDVPKSFWAARYIEEAKRLGLIKGYKTKKGNYIFRPNNKLKMSEAVAILARFDSLPLAQVETRSFSDVPVNHWSAKYIDAAKKAGMLSHIPEGRIGLKNQITRAQAVKMLSNTSVAGNLIKDLYTWEKGFRRELFYRPKIKAEEGEKTEIFAQN